MDYVEDMVPTGVNIHISEKVFPEEKKVVQQKPISKSVNMS